MWGHLLYFTHIYVSTVSNTIPVQKRIPYKTYAWLFECNQILNVVYVSAILLAELIYKIINVLFLIGSDINNARSLV